MAGTSLNNRVFDRPDSSISSFVDEQVDHSKTELSDIVSLAERKGATDIHLAPGRPLFFRLNGELVPVTSSCMTDEGVRRLSFAVLNEQQIKRVELNRDADFIWSRPGSGRCRINLSYFQGQIGAIIRLLPRNPLPLERLGLPAVVDQFMGARKGLILITGSTSQGKTTTMASLIDSVNQRLRKNVITIEDPIEYVHTYRHANICQRQVGRDTKSFSRGLRAALRQDPDIIAIGEMRDYETIKIALTAAATGVLVLSTLHIISIDKMIERLLSYAPDGRDGQIRSLLAEALVGIVHQELLPNQTGGKCVACEVLTATDAVRNLIRNRGTYHLRTIITTGARHGMQTMKTSLIALREDGRISSQTYRTIAINYP